MEETLAAGPYRPLAARPRLRPLLRLPAGRDRPVHPGAHLRQPSGRSAEDAGAGLSSVRGPDRPRDRHWSATRSRRCRSGRSSSTCAFGATHAPHQAPHDLHRQVSRPVRRRLGRGARSSGSSGRSSSASCPPDTELAPRNPGVEAWDRADRRTSRRWRCACRKPSPACSITPTRRSAGWSTSSSEIGELDNTAVHPDVGQRRQPGGRPARHASTRCSTSTAQPRDARRSMARSTTSAGRTAHNNYPWGWAQAGNTPLKWYKQNTHGGGVRDPLIVHWPAGHRDAGRHPPTSSTTSSTSRRPCSRPSASTRPTSSNGVPQMPIHGISLAYTFGAEAQDAPTTQAGAVFRDVRPPRHLGRRLEGGDLPRCRARRSTNDEWELYHLDKDFSECHDLAKENPEKLREMVDLWWSEAGKQRRAAARRPHRRSCGGRRRAWRSRATAAAMSYRPPVGRIKSTRARDRQPHLQDHGRDRSRRRRAARACSYATATVAQRLCRCTCSAIAWCSTTTCSATTSRRCRIGRCRRARRASVSRSSGSARTAAPPC